MYSSLFLHVLNSLKHHLVSHEFLNEITHASNQQKPGCLKVMVEEWPNALRLGTLFFRLVGSHPTFVNFFNFKYF